VPLEDSLKTAGATVTAGLVTEGVQGLTPTALDGAGSALGNVVLAKLTGQPIDVKNAVLAPVLKQAVNTGLASLAKDEALAQFAPVVGGIIVDAILDKPIQVTNVFSGLAAAAIGGPVGGLAGTGLNLLFSLAQDPPSTPAKKLERELQEVMPEGPGRPFATVMDKIGTGSLLTRTPTYSDPTNLGTLEFSSGKAVDDAYAEAVAQLPSNTRRSTAGKNLEDGKNLLLQLSRDPNARKDLPSGANLNDAVAYLDERAAYADRLAAGTLSTAQQKALVDQALDSLGLGGGPATGSMSKAKANATLDALAPKVLTDRKWEDPLGGGKATATPTSLAQTLNRNTRDDDDEDEGLPTTGGLWQEATASSQANSTRTTIAGVPTKGPMKFDIGAESWKKMGEEWGDTYDKAFKPLLCSDGDSGVVQYYEYVCGLKDQARTAGVLGLRELNEQRKKQGKPALTGAEARQVLADVQRWKANPATYAPGAPAIVDGSASRPNVPNTVLDMAGTLFDLFVPDGPGTASPAVTGGGTLVNAGGVAVPSTGNGKK
jgi:hypothetical protein